ENRHRGGAGGRVDRVGVGQLEVDCLEQVVLLDVRQQVGVDREAVGVAPGREGLPGVVEVVQGQGDLLEVVLALHEAGGLTDLLHRRQQEADEDGDDGDDDQQLDQRERGTSARH